MGLHGHRGAKSPKSSGNYKTLVYGAYLDTSNGNEIILYLFAPLYPVSSTIAILRNQLVYVTVLALFLAFITAIWLTRRITKSFRKISESAVRLSKGEYGIDFPGEHYTEIIDLGDVLTYISRACKIRPAQKRFNSKCIPRPQDSAYNG